MQSPHSPPRTVLLVEDEPDLADVYAEWLRPIAQTHIAHTGREALIQADETVDVVILDRNLPDQDGTAVLEELRARNEDCLVAMLTAIEPGLEIAELAVDDYRVKPISAVELRTLVETLFDRQDYDALVQQHYALTSRLSALEAYHPPNELHHHPMYRGAQTALARLETKIDAVLHHLEAHDALDDLFYDVGRCD